MQHQFKLLINGVLVDGDEHIDIIDPAVGRPFASCPIASLDQLDAAVQSARIAQRAWAETSLDHRRQLLLALADKIEANAEQLGLVLTSEQGKPLADSAWEVSFLVSAIRYFASQTLPIEVIEDNEVRRVELDHRPLGVVAAIIPWNFPLGLVGNKLPAALLAGNALIIKPAPTTPLSTLLLGEIINELVPPGLVNIIADNNDLGSALTSHPGIDKIAFTGSTATGRKVMSSAATDLKRVTLELGGNDPAIILDDVDPKKIAPDLFFSAFANTGQVCVSVKRAYVHERIYDELVSELTSLAQAAKVGDGREEGVKFGPIQNAAQYNKAIQYLEIASRDGKITAGGAMYDRGGYFVRPTIVRDIDEKSPLVVEEQFSPILPLIPFSDEDEAVAKANALPYGLGASVWSSDLDRAYALSKRIQAGTVWINQHLALTPNVPVPAAKQSGIGVALGLDGLKSYTQLTVTNIKK
ncbi:aldehyde dehydrogenase family protein [Paraburkholderia caribensis]|uniref:aldehyde dehydrogenase family protein n=1 Tax=Paraburkholderia caribensis TaxID=75105 RepID=UPI001CAE1561|nr:aldehyde dehydrogenase family protein [Paraburkholderia caribensis]CAG9243759.1 Aldehyde dehydrogenase [Paraburkholderia caribensis]